MAFVLFLVRECNSNPCVHGTCIELEDTEGYNCSCSSGYNGKHCEKGTIVMQ